MLPVHQTGRFLSFMQMADPLSIGASVVAFIGLADRVIRAGQYCIDSVKDAPNDIKMILGEVTSLRAIVESLDRPELINGTSPNLVLSLFGTSGPIDICLHCLSQLEALLPANSREASRSGTSRITLSQLAWPLKQSKARKLLAEISYNKATLLLAISGNAV